VDYGGGVGGNGLGGEEGRWWAGRTRLHDLAKEGKLWWTVATGWTAVGWIEMLGW
jgi:hypothetical protein